MHDKHMENINHLAQFVLKEVKRRRIDNADLLARREREDTVTAREGQVETVRRKITRGLGLRVIQDGRLGFAHTSDVSEPSLVALVDRAIALAKEASPDPGHGIAKPEPVPPWEKLDLVDATLSEVTVEEKIDQVLRLEKAMMSADPRIARSAGANWHDGENDTVILNTEGLSVSYRGTWAAIVGQAIAEDNNQMQRGFWYSQARHREDLDSPEEVGMEAGKRTATMLGAKPVSTIKAPVVFEAPMASQVLGILFSALNGETVRKRASYLVDQLGEQIASPIITVIDDGSLPRKLGSAAVDDEGVPARRKVLVDKGMLEQYLYDIRGARLSKSFPTGNASRSYGSLPSVGPTNTYLEPGSRTREDVIGSVEKGLFLTRIMGSGVNLVTGDASWGAGGFWIEHGELTHPVEGVTVAGNLKNLWRHIDMVADDLEWRTNVASPTFKVKEMMIGGK